MTLAELKRLIALSPTESGIYRFQDIDKKDIYIGKAASIKKRLASYLRATDSRIKKILSGAKYLSFVKTESDIEALILESQLIKQKRPKFNIMLRDDKQYFYIVFSNDEFPKITLTHQIENWKLKTGNCIGPFTDGSALKATLKYLRNIFPYCTCKQDHHNFCLNYHIGKCVGFCCLKESKENIIANREEIKKQYQQNIKAIKDILNGQKTSLVRELQKEMSSAGKEHDFGRAIDLRKKLERLERVFYNAKVIKHSEILKSHNSELPKLLKINKPIIKIEGYDISNIQGKHATGSMVTFVNGIPDKNLYRKFKISPNFAKTNSGGQAKHGDTQMLQHILERRLNHTEWPFPDLILIDGGKAQVNAVLSTLKEMGVTLPVVGMLKNDKHIGHQLVTQKRKQPLSLSKLTESDKNLLLNIDTEAHRFAISYYRQIHRKSI